MQAKLEDRIKEIQARVDKATEGPWEQNQENVVAKGYTLFFTYMSHRNDAKFIAHARQDIPYILAALQEAQAKIVKLENRLQISPYGDDKIDELESAIGFMQHTHDVAIKQAAAREQGLRTALLNAKAKVDNCVTKVRQGLGAGGHGCGMYMEISTGNVVLDAVQDYIDEAFEQEGKP